MLDHKILKEMKQRVCEVKPIRPYYIGLSKEQLQTLKGDLSISNAELIEELKKRGINILYRDTE